MSIDITSISTNEIIKEIENRRRDEKHEESRKIIEALRNDAIEAIKNLSPEKLTSVLVFLSSKKKAARNNNGSNSGSNKSIYRWDESIQKNRKVNEFGGFIEPPVLMRGPKSSTPIH